MKFLSYVFLLIFSFILLNTSNVYAVRNRKTNPYELYSLYPSNLAPNGKLAKIFDTPSDYTDLQREDTLEEIKNTLISWTVPVYEVKRDGDDSYLILTMSNSNVVGCYIHLTIFDDKQKKFVHSLKTGSRIPFRGIITGKTFMRNLIINPAVLENDLIK